MISDPYRHWLPLHWGWAGCLGPAGINGCNRRYVHPRPARPNRLERGSPVSSALFVPPLRAATQPIRRPKGSHQPCQNDDRYEDYDQALEEAESLRPEAYVEQGETEPRHRSQDGRHDARPEGQIALSRLDRQRRRLGRRARHPAHRRWIRWAEDILFVSSARLDRLGSRRGTPHDDPTRSVARPRAGTVRRNFRSGPGCRR